MPHSPGLGSRSSGVASIFRKRIGSTSPRREWRRSAPIARSSSERGSHRRVRRTTGSRRRCAGIPCSRRSMPAPAARHSLALGLVASPWVATTLKGRLRRDCLAKWECARAEGVGLGEREARTAKQPQGPAKVPRGVEIPAGRRNRRVSGAAIHRDAAKPSGLSVAKRLRESRAGHR